MLIEVIKSHGVQSKNLNTLKTKIEKSMKQIAPRSAKNKGREWQQEVCRAISDITGIEYRQEDDNCEIHSREMGLSGADIILRGAAKKLFNYVPECKSCTNLSLPDWIRQAAFNCDGLNNWILFVKSPTIEGKKIVILNFENFKEVMKKYVRH